VYSGTATAGASGVRARQLARRRTPQAHTRTHTARVTSLHCPHTTASTARLRHGTTTHATTHNANGSTRYASHTQPRRHFRPPADRRACSHSHHTHDIHTCMLRAPIQLTSTAATHVKVALGRVGGEAQSRNSLDLVCVGPGERWQATSTQRQHSRVRGGREAPLALPMVPPVRVGSAMAAQDASKQDTTPKLF